MIIKNLKKENKIFLTIDFEDWYYDFSDKIKSLHKKNFENNLERIYDEIECILSKHGISVGITYFITGNVIKRYPNLVKKIAKNNEIALHSFKHISPKDLTFNEFILDIEKAVGVYKKVLLASPTGYRAPNFGTNNDTKYLSVISKNFKYDSSYQLSNFKHENKFQNIFEVPIYENDFIFKNRIIGGTFLKIYPYNLIKKFINDSIKNSFFPIIYLHPYELTCDYTFYVNCFRNNNLSVAKKLYWSLRQFQWLGMCNFFVKKKLDLILKDFEVIGRIDKYLK
jgi:hypothetical protein